MSGTITLSKSSGTAFTIKNQETCNWRNERVFLLRPRFTGMEDADIAVGMLVRYPRTGTSGTVVRLEPHDGKLFAELDSTGLLYHSGELIPAELRKTVTTKQTADAKNVIEQERAYMAGSELQEALKNIDQSCEGGG